MPRMGLDHHRAAGGERRSGIAAGDREGKREVGGAEHGDRADRLLDLAQIRGRVGRGIDAYAEIITAPQDLGEQAQLAGRAADFAGQAFFRQGGLAHGFTDDRLAECFDLVGTGLEERRPGFRIGGREGIERVVRGSRCGGDFFRCRFEEILLVGGVVFGRFAGKRALAGSHAGAADELLAGDLGHGKLLFRSRQ